MCNQKLCLAPSTSADDLREALKQRLRGRGLRQGDFRDAFDMLADSFPSVSPSVRAVLRSGDRALSGRDLRQGKQCEKLRVNIVKLFLPHHQHTCSVSAASWMCSSSATQTRPLSRRALEAATFHPCPVCG